MTLIANISLAIAALLSLLGMLRRDTSMLQRNQFSNSRFYSHLQEKGEISSTSRLVVIAVLIGSITSMAKDSWMVVAILAAVLAITGIYLLFKKHADAQPCSGRAIGVLSISFIISGIATAAAGLCMSSTSTDSAYNGALTLLLCAVISPLLVMLSNWLLGLFMKNEKNGTKSSDDK